MANLDLQSVELVSTLRTAPENGAPSSADYYDGELEKLTDLGTLAAFINNTLLPMLNALPDVAATGLLGTSCYSDISAQDPLVYDSSTDTPLMITDSLRVLYGQIQTVQTSITYLSQQVVSLQARLSASGQDDISIALQGITSTLANNSAQLISLANTVSNLQQGNGILSGTIYSAAGTPLPDAATYLTGIRATVSDNQTTLVGNPWGSLYTSGGGDTVPVWCDGEAWRVG